jgi:hypothetical protein
MPVFQYYRPERRAAGVQRDPAKALMRKRSLKRLISYTNGESSLETFFSLALRMKRFFPVAILLIFSLQFFGLYFYYALKLTVIRQEMARSFEIIPVEQLQRFEFLESEYLMATVDANEVKIGGDMYDIARTENKDGCVTIFALHDTGEEDLISFLGAVLDKTDDHQKTPSSHLLKLLTVQYLPSAFSFAITRSELDSPATTYATADDFFKPDCLSPPPEFHSHT